ncbi:type I-B CRISPR-associated protein Cas7/Cst2/DevR [Fusobacterium necrophorum subsp. funduliforme]|uniref:Type I-B CRISPR-associated protein Cas7/Cst2/DevR n=1 Tax=Fusobacterium necrophorum subsp. funduliforme TaxID=143387 RepID=A0A162IVS5_9FUSO|nr:type I-B CRISPR-associated protein Cas7/Cst2/DevR [Fusobacterium necrophorum]AYV92655.1 type I-B CRISPR-associated protein Cas7/Cst2/DevR [Fusobacterium necrophorum subsp. funduliforme]KYL04550.1 type I-B CRISPR-associated protein Cas7/Cst2/DevR [Fusobacterium necrophorum subsp. funduliforme]KYM44200.1 type I-B CRISPR-associated protein Cas7/Cst2/DevR [Fusobacterium necrophorum subsp. funduliforme]KYM62001.1 type I-B CRISPR-associated protein Cas7/Cst2/DevR [Fusobacterium necrophorum subsp. 
MKKNSLTLTVIANMTSNYSEGLGNISSVQKVYKNRAVYSIRSRESLKNALMVQSGMYEDLRTVVSGVTQKNVTPELNASNCRALEGGYMCTVADTYVRNSSFYLTDAISTESFVNETRFHNNLYLATNYAKANGLNVQVNAGTVGLMPYQYEYEKSPKVYSITIDLEKIGKDENFKQEAGAVEKYERVKCILEAVQNLSLVVKGNLDNAEPMFIIGGLSERKTHYFENVVKTEQGALILGEDLITKKKKGFRCALLRGDNFTNEEEILKTLQPISMEEFFDSLIREVKEYYQV